MNARAESNFTERRQAAIRRPLASGGDGGDDGYMRERVAVLETTIGTIRAEMRANLAEIQSSNSETRSTILSAIERLRTDTVKDVLGVKIWVLVGVVLGLASMIGGFWWIAQQFLAPILQHTH